MLTILLHCLCLYILYTSVRVLVDYRYKNHVMQDEEHAEYRTIETGSNEGIYQDEGAGDKTREGNDIVQGRVASGEGPRMPPVVAGVDRLEPSYTMCGPCRVARDSD